MPLNTNPKTGNKILKDRLRSAMNARFFIYAMMVMAQVFGSLFGFGSVTVKDLFSIPAAQAAEGISHTINYQGKLMNSSGATVANGNYNIKFTVYDSATGGNQLWSASTTNGLPTGTSSTVSVAVTSGLFTILLGDASDNQVAFPDSLFNNDALYLGVTIGSDSEMTPRKRLSAVPYAYNSEMLQGQYASSSSLGSDANLFALNQASSTSAYATRTALYIQTHGNDNAKDFLVRGNNGTSDVFSISRQGNVTTTGNLEINGTTIIGSATDTPAIFNGYVNSNFVPYTDNVYTLGTNSYRWKNLYATNVSSTNIDALGYVSTTSLYINGTLFTGSATPNLQQVTDIGAITTNAIWFAGATSSGNFVPGTTAAYNLGSENFKWNGVYTDTSFISSRAYVGYGVVGSDPDGLYVNHQLYAYATSTFFDISTSGRVSSSLLPYITNTYYLGNSTYRWKGLTVGSVSSTNIDATGYVSTTNLYVGGATLNNKYFLPNGNSFGAATVLGTNDSNSLSFETNNTTWSTIGTTGQIALNGPANTGVNAAGYKLYINSYDNDDTNHTYPFYAIDENAAVDFYLRSRYPATGNSLAFFQGDMQIGNSSEVADKTLTITSLGDTGIILAADTNNVTETDNPYVYFSQDGGTIESVLGVTGDNGRDPLNNLYTNAIQNSFLIGQKQSNPVQFGTNNTVRMTIDGTGNVGIGTNDPQFPLAISKTNANKDVLLIQESTGGAGNTANIAFKTDAGNGTDSIMARIRAYDQGTWNADMIFEVSGDSVQNVATTEAMRIQYNGNVGIGDSTPASLLTVGNGDLFQVDSNGNIIKIRNVTYSFPNSQGASNSYLKNDGAGTLTWASVAGVGTPTWQEVTDSGASTTHWISFYGASSTGNINPSVNNTYDLGTPSSSWRNLYVSSTAYITNINSQNITVLNVSSTNIDASGYISTTNLYSDTALITNVTTTNLYNSGTVSTTVLYVNGTLITGTETQDLQDVTDIGAVTTNRIQFAGATSVGSILPSTSLAYNLGSSAYRWNEIWASSTRIGTSTWDLWQANDGFTISKNNLADRYLTITNSGNLMPRTGNSQDIGSFTSSWKSIYASGTIYGTELNITGTSTLANVIPQATNLYDFGASGLAFRDIYASDTIYGGDLNIEQNGISLVGTFNTTGNNSRGGVTVGDTLYMVDNSKLNIYDISNPENPTLLGSTAATSSYKVVVQGDMAYVAAWTDGIKVFDVSNPAAPVQTGTLDMTTTYCRDIVVRGDYAYLACHTDGVRVVDISSSTNPILYTTVDPGGYAYGLDMVGNYVYVANGIGAPDFFVIDISNQEAPYIAGTFDPGDDCFNVTVRGDYAYVSEFDASGFSIYNVSNPASMSKVGSGATAGDGLDIWFDDNTGYVWLTEGDAATSFSVWDVSNPASPSKIYTYDPAYGVAYLTPTQNGDYVYIGSDSANTTAYIFDTGLGLATMESSYVSGPAILGNVLAQRGMSAPGASNPGEGRMYFDSTDNKFYISENGGIYGDLTLQGITNRGNTTDNSIIITANTPSYVGKVQDNTYLDGPYDMKVVGNYAYTVGYDSDYFSIWDVSNPAAPVRLGSYANAIYTDGAYYVDVRGNYAYITAELGNDFTVIDISDPSSPTLAANLPTNNGAGIYLDGASEVKVYGNYAYVASRDDNALEIIDISDPTAPIHAGSLVHNGTTVFMQFPNNLDVVGNYAYVAGRTSDSVQIIDISDPTNPVAKGYITETTCGAGICELDGANALQVVGNYAYISSYDDDGLEILDISSSTNPVHVGAITENGTATNLNGSYDIQVVGDYAYIAAYDDSGIEIVDISSSTNPVHYAMLSDASNFYLSQASALQIVGGYLYVASRAENGIQVLSLSQLNTPTAIIGKLDTGDLFVTDNARVGSDLFVGNSVYAQNDLSVGNNLRVDGNTVFNGVEYSWPGADGTSGYVLTTDSSGNLTWGTNAVSLQAVTDVGYTTDNPMYQTYATPTFIGLIRDNTQGGTANYLNDARTVKTVGNIAYVISYIDGAISSFSLASSTNPIELDSLVDGGSTLLANAEDMEIDGNYAYILSEESSLEIVDISDPYNLTHVGSLAVTGGSASAIAVGNGYAYLGKEGTTDIYVVDVSDPTAPSSVATYTAGGSMHIDNPVDMEIVGNYLFVASTGTDSVAVLDVSDPLNTVETDYVTDGGVLVDPYDLTVNGDYIYVAAETSDCLVIIDKHNVSDIFVSDSMCESGNSAYYELDGASAVDYAAGYAYVYSSADAGIAVVNVVSSTNVTYIASLSDTASTFLTGTNRSGINITDSGLLLQTDDSSDTLHVFELARFVSPAANFGTLSTQNFENTNQAKFYGKVSISGPLELNNVTYLFPGGDGNNGDILKTDGTGNLTWGLFDNMYINSITVDSVICDTESPTCSAGQKEATGMDGAADIFVRDDYAYVAGLLDDTIQIIDVSDSLNPEPLGSVTDVALLDEPRAIFVNGDYAYVAGAQGDFTIIDIINLTTPTILGNIDNATYFSSSTSIYVAGKYAYITAEISDSLTIVEISDPNNPFVVGSIAGLDGAWDVKVVGNYAYVTENVGDKLTIIDVKNPAYPVEVGSIADGVATHLDGARGLDVVGKYAYVTGYADSGISIISITSSTNPVEVGHLDDNTGGSRLLNASDIMVEGNYAYVTAYGDDGVDVIDISSSTNPTHVVASADLTSTLDGPEKIYAANGKIYATGKTSDSLVIFNIPTFTAPSAQIGDLAATNFTVYNDAFFNNDVYISGSLHGMDLFGDTVNGNNIYARNNIYATGTTVSNNMWTQKMDASNPSSASVTQIASVAVGSACHGGAAIQGNYYYHLCGGNGNPIKVVDVSNPSNPVYIASTALATYSFGIKIKGKYAYTSNYNGDIQVVDISIPTAPSVVKTIDAGGSNVTFHDVSGNYLYYPDPAAGTLEIYDISNPVTTSNTPVGSVSTRGTSPRNVVVQGDYAYVSNWNNTVPNISVIDISNPTSPVFVATTTVGIYPTGIAVQGRYLYVIHHNINTMEIIDIKDPTNPVVVKTFDWGGYRDLDYSQGFVVQGRYAYILRNADYMSIVDISSSTNPAIVATPYFYGNGAGSIAVSGRYIYTDVYTGSTFRVFDMGGIETNGLIADSARLGNLQVLGSANVSQSLSVQGGLQIGTPGINSLGKISSNGDLEILGNDSIAGNTTIGGNTAITGTLTVGNTATMHSIVPAANITYDLGSASYRWKDLYVAEMNSSDLTISPRTPTFVSGLSLGTYASAIDISGKYAYLGHSQYGVNEFSVADISDPTKPRILGGIDVGTNHVVSDVEAVGGYVYTANTSNAANSYEIQLIDVSNPISPTLVSGVNTAAANCNDVLVSGNYVYAACYNATDAIADLYIIDYTDKNNPVVTTSTNITADGAYTLEKYGDYLIVGTQNATNYNVGADVLIFNVSNPYLATYVGGYNTGANAVAEITLKGNYLYVGSLTAVNSYEFMIFDVSNPSSMAYKGGVNLYTNNVSGIQVGIDYAYVLNLNNVAGQPDLYAINISSSTNPTIVNSLDIGTNALYDLKMDGTKLYIVGNGETIAGQYTGLEFLIFDVAGVTTPSADIGDLYAGNMNVSEDAMFNKDVYINSGLTVGKNGINLFGQLSVASSSKFFGTMQTSNIRPLTNNTYNLGSDTYRYKDAYFSGTIDTKPATAVRQGGFNVGAVVNSIFLKDKYLYVGTFNETVTGRAEDFQIYDITDPKYPKYVRGISNSTNLNGTKDIKVIGSYAYVLKENNSNVPYLYVYNISDPYNVTLMSSVAFSNSNNGANNMAIYDNHAYVVGKDSFGTMRLYVIDISNPASISIVNTLTSSGGEYDTALNVYNGNLYVGSSNMVSYGSYDLAVFSLRNPASPQYIGGGNIDTGRVLDMYFSGDYAYVGTTNDNIYIVDISSSTVPTIKSTIDAGGQDIQDIQLMDNYLVVGAYNNGPSNNAEVLVYDVSSSTSVGAPIMTIDIGGTSPVYEMALYGKNLVVATLNTATGGSDFEIYDLGGIKAQAADIGSLRSNILRVTEDAYFGNNLYVSGGIYSGLGGIHTNGGLTAQATSTLADLKLNGRVNSDWLPYTDNTYDLGNSTYRWRNLQAVNATFTTLYVVNPAQTNAFLQNGNSFGTTAVLGTNDNYNLNIETNGVTRVILDTNGSLYPTSTNAQDLGLTTNRWDDIWGATLHVGTSTWDITQPANGNFTIAKGSHNYVNIWDTGDNIAIGDRSGYVISSGINNVGYGSYTLFGNQTGSNNTALGNYALSHDGSGGSFSYNTAVGSDAMSSMNNGSYNTALGARSLLSLTTGASNTALGFESMASNTTGYYNTAIGLQALFSNTIGNINTGIGALALYNNQDGSNNIGIGAASMFNNISGDDNIAIGVATLYDNLTSDIIAIGKNALEHNTTGIQNTSIGIRALNQNVTGINNTALGYNSMVGSIGNSHSYNTAIGARSLFSITSGASNTAIGSDSLYSNTIGYYNVGIGTGSLSLNSSGNFNVAIGAFTLASNTTNSYLTAVGTAAMNANSTGVENTALGASALLLQETGSRNTALGTYALRGSGGTKFSANDNVAVGNRALSSISGNGSYNTAIGNSSLYSVSTGASNTAVGYESMRGNTTGNRNIGIGMNALYSNTAGIRNSVIGHNAGYSIQGSYNTLNGADSGYSITAGNYNTAMGYRSFFGGAGSPVASFNTGIGSFALSNITTGASNTAVGYTAGANITTGYKNVAIGLESLYTNGVGSNNVAIGSGAARTNSTGNEIVAIGTEALYNSTVSANTAVGYRAMYYGSSGNYNVSLGGFSSYYNQTGTYNTAIGYSALTGGSVNSSSKNTAVGSYAINGVTSGSENSALGVSAMQSLSSGASNTAMGYQALYNNTSGNANVAIGYQSLRSNVSGFSNTSIGTKSLYSLTSGFGNVAIGDFALNSFTGNGNSAVGFGALFSAGTTDVENTAFGYVAGYNTGAGASEITGNTAIGHQALYTNASGVGNTALGSSAVYSGGNISYRTGLGLNALYDGGSSGATAVGAAAGENLLSTGDYFTAVGYNAGHLTTSGDWNTFIGYDSGSKNTVGGVNTAVGAQSLYINTTGGYNTAMGQGTLYSMNGGSYNTAIGAHSGFYVSSTASYNTSLGYNSLYGSATLGSTGEYNTALGLGTMEGNNTGHRNVAVGAVSLTNNTSGYYNVGVGVDSLQQNTSGFGNIGIGFEASLNNSTGYYNTAIGHNAMKGVSSNNPSINTAVGAFALDAITSGIGNSGLGYAALSTLTSGDNNTAMGLSSLYYVSSGNGNSAFGYEAGFYAGTGEYNTAMGYHALYGGSTYNASGNVAIGGYALDAVTNGGSYNVAAGYNALGTLISGLYNVGVGYNAGTAITYGSGNTFLGYGADAGGDYSNATAIGYNASVNASNRAMIGNGQDVGGSSAWNDWSDARMKYDIADNNLGLEFINALRPRSFRFTATSTVSHAGRLEEGFIAQEVEQTMLDLDVNFSGLMLPENSSDYYRLAYSKFTIPLVNSVQEISASSSPLWNGIAIDSNFAALEEPFMQVDTDGNIAYKGVSITSKGIATSSTQAFDSYTFSYKGSAWNTDTAQEITTSFDVFNNTISATSSELKFIYTTGTGFTQNLLTITNSGDVHVSGDLHVGRRLYLGSNTSGEASTSTYIFVDDTLSPTSTYIATNADGWQTESTYDYAERYESSEDLIPGDLVTTDPSGVNLVKRATSPSEPLLGIVSTKPGFVTGRHYEGWYPIALAGRVPTRVSTVDGAIRVGDYLTVSSNYPGVAVKATAGSNTIGVALEDYDNAEVGLISVFVERDRNNSLGYTEEVVYGPASIVPPTSINGLGLIKAGQKEVQITYPSTQGYPVVTITPYGSITGKYWVSNVSDIGFTITLSDEQTFDLTLGYEVSLLNVTDVMSSGGTTGQIDELTGAISYPENPNSEVTNPPDPPTEPAQNPPPEGLTSTENLDIDLSTSPVSL